MIESSPNSLTDTTPDCLTLPVPGGADVLGRILREGTQRLLAHAIQAEAEERIDARAAIVNERGHRQVVRNSHLPERTLTTQVGPIKVRQPRIRDRRRQEEAETFTSKILPPYLRKSRAIEELIPWLYLKGLSTGDFNEALQALVGVNAAGLSASTITRMIESWQEEDRQCILVLMGATAEGRKELIAVHDGHRESEQSWKTLLLEVKHRGLTIDPRLATGDGALGFWKALAEVFPTTRGQRCWVHKTANVLDKLPRRAQPQAKAMLHDIWMASTKAEANRAFDLFLATYEAKYPHATDCLAKDRETLLTF